MMKNTIDELLEDSIRVTCIGYPSDGRCTSGIQDSW